MLVLKYLASGKMEEAEPARQSPMLMLSPQRHKKLFEAFSPVTGLVKGVSCSSCSICLVASVAAVVAYA